MAEFAARVMGVITGPEYRPMTLKAHVARASMSKPTITPNFAVWSRADPRGKARSGAGTRRSASPDRSGMIVGLFPPLGQGFRVRAAARRGPRSRQILHPAGGNARRFERRRGHRQDHASGPARRGECRRADRRGLIEVSRGLCRHLFRGRRHQLRQGRRDDIPRADLGGRSRGEGGQARRQGRDRDRAIPITLSRRRRSHHRDPRPARGSRASTR